MDHFCGIESRSPNRQKERNRETETLKSAGLAEGKSRIRILPNSYFEGFLTNLQDLQAEKLNNGSFVFTDQAAMFEEPVFRV